MQNIYLKIYCDSIFEKQKGKNHSFIIENDFVFLIKLSFINPVNVIFVSLTTNIPGGFARLTNRGLYTFKKNSLLSSETLSALGCFSKSRKTV